MTLPTARHRLSLAAVLLAVPGYIALSILLGSEVTVWLGVRDGIDTTTLATLFGATHPT